MTNKVDLESRFQSLDGPMNSQRCDRVLKVRQDRTYLSEMCIKQVI